MLITRDSRSKNISSNDNFIAVTAVILQMTILLM